MHSDLDAPARPRARVIFWLSAVALFLVDLSTKEWALSALADGPVDVIGDWFQFRLVFNPGAAFSTGTGVTWVFTAIACVATVTVLWLSRRLRSPLWSFGLGMLLAGIVGNLFDRIFRQPEAFHGHVVDFLSFGSFPVFNVADMCINVAAAVIVLQTFRGVRLDGTRERDDDDDTAAQAPAGQNPVSPEAPVEQDPIDQQQEHR
ncbi:signal peptidase II [Nocardioides yefusunii]|uniref:Lipoprotein signal peptidase n=1 Tax=Nocardioides yefusunii TaxID=2500546 RepID=A0ABW1QY32_9ACTN|nr:signal peptidase II [Nocardioides yefusunii]